MNHIVGIISWNLDNQFHYKVANYDFQTPHWKPDRQNLYADSFATFSAKERFITPQCSLTPVPYIHSSSRTVIIADVYLTNHAELCNQLNLTTDTSDVQLILESYLKWGRNCTKHLAGSFCFAIWSIEKHELFAATDQFGSRPFYYCYLKDMLIFANEMSIFKQLSLPLNINLNQFKRFALDTPCSEETCYLEVKKLPPAHQVCCKPGSFIIHRYWNLNEQKKGFSFRKREEYYEAFQSVFAKATKNALRTSYLISSHVSGGLDSSAITCQAADFLSKLNDPLFAMTAVPMQLSGSSYRKGWQYHELPLVHSLLKKFPNIEHHIYTSQLDAPIYQNLANLHPMLDQPIRNVFNFDWIMGCCAYAQQQNSRVLLIGQHGNGSISWTGISLRNRLGSIYHWLSYQMKLGEWNDYYQYLSPELLKSNFGKIWIKKRLPLFNLHYKALTGYFNGPFMSPMHALSLWQGIEQLDPSRDLEVISFCYQVPQKIYQRGREMHQRRLLVREGLRDLMPNEIVNNVLRGEQAADWFLQFNHSGKQWKENFDHLSHKAQELLWQCYDKTLISELWSELPQPIQVVKQDLKLKYGLVLPRVLSCGFFLDYLLTN